MSRRVLSGWMFLLVPAHPGRPGQRAVKQSCVCVCLLFLGWVHVLRVAVLWYFLAYVFVTYLVIYCVWGTGFVTTGWWSGVVSGQSLTTRRWSTPSLHVVLVMCCHLISYTGSTVTLTHWLCIRSAYRLLTYMLLLFPFYHYYTRQPVSQYCQLKTAGFCWSKILLPACPC